MKITIHKGSHEIGGNCIQISSGKTTILLDAGLPLNPESKPVDHHGSRLGEIDGKYFRDSHGARLAEFDGRDVRDSHGSRIATIDDVKKSIDGIGGASLVAMWLFFVR